MPQESSAAELIYRIISSNATLRFSGSLLYHGLVLQTLFRQTGRQSAFRLRFGFSLCGETTPRFLSLKCRARMGRRNLRLFLRSISVCPIR